MSNCPTCHRPRVKPTPLPARAAVEAAFATLANRRVERGIDHKWVVNKSLRVRTQLMAYLGLASGPRPTLGGAYMAWDSLHGYVHGLLSETPQAMSRAVYLIREVFGHRWGGDPEGLHPMSAEGRRVTLRRVARWRRKGTA